MKASIADTNAESVLLLPFGFVIGRFFFMVFPP
jgi:hypothetical protein